MFYVVIYKTMNLSHLLCKIKGINEFIKLFIIENVEIFKNNIYKFK